MYRICWVFCFVCLLAFFGCSFFFEDSGTSSDDHKWKSATSHGSALDVYLAIYCPRDMSCRSTLQLDGTPEPSKSYTMGFHYTFIGGNDTLIAEDDWFIDGTDSVRSWNLPVTDRHVRFSLLDKKKKRKDYDIDLSPWLGEVFRTEGFVSFTKFSVGSEVCFYKFQESFCRTILDETEQVAIPNDSSYYPFYRVKQKYIYFKVGKYTDELSIMTTVYWR